MDGPILVVGSVALDTIATPFDRAEDELGGSATHFSLAASIFSPVQLVAVVGNDFPQEHIQLLEEHGVNLQGLQVAEGPSFRWSGQYHYDMNTRDTLDLQLNVFAEFQPSLPEEYRDAQIIFLANIDPALQLSVLEQVKAPQFIACDTMDIWIETKREELTTLLSRVDALVLNDSEAREFAQEANLLKAARHIQGFGPRVVVIKKGEHGALLVVEQDVFVAPAFPLDTVMDPTGAGDAFAGGLMGFLAEAGSHDQDDLRRAVVHGTAVASFSVERFGVQRLVDIDRAAVAARVEALRDVMRF